MRADILMRISGAKSRNAMPGLDEMLKDAGRRRFDVAMAWAIDRLGRSPESPMLDCSRK